MVFMLSSNLIVRSRKLNYNEAGHDDDNACIKRVLMGTRGGGEVGGVVGASELILA